MERHAVYPGLLLLSSKLSLTRLLLLLRRRSTFLGRLKPVSNNFFPSVSAASLLFLFSLPPRRSTFLGRLKPVSSRVSLLLPAAPALISEGMGGHAISAGAAAARAVLQKGLTSVQVGGKIGSKESLPD